MSSTHAAVNQGGVTLGAQLCSFDAFLVAHMVIGVAWVALLAASVAKMVATAAGHVRTTLGTEHSCATAWASAGASLFNPLLELRIAPIACLEGLATKTFVPRDIALQAAVLVAHWATPLHLVYVRVYLHETITVWHWTPGHSERGRRRPC